MKKWPVVLLLLMPRLSASNPVDSTPIAEFSELVFDENGYWTLELFFPLGGMEEIPDSIVIRAGDHRSRLKTVGRVENRIRVITSDSLNEPIPVNRDGDTLEVMTYSGPDIHRIRRDGLIFGDRPGASVGKPAGGYSILRSRFEARMNMTTVDCLTRNPSLGEVNVLTGLDATLRGTLFNNRNEPATGLKKEIWGGTAYSPYYLELETPIRLSPDGTYSTSIYRRFDKELVSHLTVKIDDFEGYSDTTRIDAIELNGIHPDTEVVQDIRLKSDRFIDRVPENREIPEREELTLINYPNPFNGSTHFFIKFPDRMGTPDGRILILDAKGRTVRELPVSGRLRLSWDGHDRNGFDVPSGCYFYRFVLGDRTLRSGSMLLLR
jgi:hypothetical protein